MFKNNTLQKLQIYTKNKEFTKIYEKNINYILMRFF